VGSQPAIAGVQAEIDTGTDVIFGPELDVVKFYKAIPGSKDATDTFGQGHFTCELNFVKLDGTKTKLSAFLSSPL
jgi:hypothetical protein